MTDRYDILSGRPGKDGKTFWVRLGSMFPAREGDGFAIKLDALPLPNEKGECWIKAAPAKPRDENGSSGR
jgi:hypothetical protein